MLSMNKISSFFNVFKIFVKIFVHNENTGSVVTYLIFEFLQKTGCLKYFVIVFVLCVGYVHTYTYTCA